MFGPGGQNGPGGGNINGDGTINGAGQRIVPGTATGTSPGTVAGTGGAGTTTGGGGQFSSPTLVPPSDPNEFASYLAAQRAGGALQGSTSISQADALAGTRFARVADPTQWHASVARDYAAQFAAYAVGADPLSAQGLAAGQQAFSQMSPEAQTFMQVASVFKGNLFNGPGLYDNPGLGQLLQSTGNADLINNPQVGQTDVQTIGAVTQALNRGSLTLNQVLQSGTIDNLDRYFQIINYVQSGGFAGDLNRYENAPI